jgi:hypothetical protein
MPTVKELRVIAKQFGLRVGGRKAELEERIQNARQEELASRQNRNRNKGSKQIEDEITASLRAKKVEKIVAKKNVPPEHKQLLSQIRNKERREIISKELKRNDTISKLLKRIDKKRKLKSVPKAINEKGAAILDAVSEKEIETDGKRTKTFELYSNVNVSVVDRLMTKLSELPVSFYLRYRCAYWLINIETGKRLLFYSNLGRSDSLITNLEMARAWLTSKEEVRLSLDKLDRPSTKWSFVGWSHVWLKVIMTNQPLLGRGRLPDWLRQKKGLYSLDTYDDNMCVFRCLAIHRGARVDRCEREVLRLANDYYEDKEIKRIPLNKLAKVEEKFKIGIRVYEPNENGVWRLIRQPAHYDAILGKDGVMTIGFYNNHAFLITDIKKVVNIYACGHCDQQFTNSQNLQRHADRCSRGEAKLVCVGSQVERPESAYERAFYPRGNASFVSIRWIEHESRQRGSHIHHLYCGHGGERMIAEAYVDGYEPTTKTVFQFHGCQWHGCPDHCKREDAKVRYDKTLAQDDKIRKAGYNLIVMWECKKSRYDNVTIPSAQTVVYPYEIVFDFEAYLDKTKNKKPTADLTFENQHVPISVSIGDNSGETETTHLQNTDPKLLIRDFMNEIERRAEIIREKVRDEFMPEDINLLPLRQREFITSWCDQVTVLGFNSGKYDLNLIHNYFVSELTDKYAVAKVAKNGQRTMFIITKELKFLDVINYLGPGTSYESWVKAYDCRQTKSFFPYEWFDSADKLNYPGLPDYVDWYSKHKGDTVLTWQEWRQCKKIFKERNMRTFADWLEYYNNLDVEPFIEAADKMKAFYGDKGIDIFKDAVSLPGVSLQYLLRGSIGSQGKLFVPGKTAYEILKTGVSGGPSIVFSRYHEARKTKIRQT